MAYATVEDLEARWRELSGPERTVASALLDDAAALIDSHGEPASAAAARAASCSMARRAMQAQANDLWGVTQASMTAGSYQQQLTYQNPSGDLYLTKAELRMLGFAGGRAGFARPWTGGGA